MTKYLKIIIAVLTLFQNIGNSQTIDSTLLSLLNNNLINVGDTIELDYNLIEFIKTHRDENIRKTNSIKSFLIENKNIELEIRVHTDCLGRTKYKRALSERVAEDFKLRICSDLINTDRIVAIGMGSKFPKIDCKCRQCKDYELEMNERVEIELKSDRVIDARLVWNLSEFEGFYGLPDSIVQFAQDTINKVLSQNPKDKETLNFINDYEFLKLNKLLFKPCKILIYQNEKIRVFFDEEDKAEINKSNWFSKNKIDKKHTFLKMTLNKIKGNTYFCKELISIYRKDSI